MADQTDDAGGSSATSIVTDVPLPMPTPSPAAAPDFDTTISAGGGDGSPSSESKWKNKNGFGIVIPPDTRNQGGISLKASEFARFDRRLYLIDLICCVVLLCHVVLGCVV